MKPPAASEGHEWALIHVTVIKDAQARSRPTPIPVRRLRMGGQLGEDALCTYDALRITWMEREHAVAVEEHTFGKRSDTPFFTAEDG
eukprot:5611786-Pleurochrysis_carterae.AAC.1